MLRRRAATFLVLLSASLTLATEGRAAPKMVVVGPGIYRPFYPTSNKEKELPIPAFRLDVLPVTNRDFLVFVRDHAKWRRDQVPRLFADAHYLEHWKGPAELGPNVDALQPVVGVSWFAAKAYCAARGARLPREGEWEFAAGASLTQADGRDDPELRERLVTWYSHKNPPRLPRVGTTPANFWHVHDLHGLIWEWVLDFNSTLVSADDRERGDGEKMRFCGIGALNANDAADYVSFMRTAFRSSLHADFTTKNLGFRCAADLPERNP